MRLIITELEKRLLDTFRELNKMREGHRIVFENDKFRVAGFKRPSQAKGGGMLYGINVTLYEKDGSEQGGSLEEG